MVRKSSNASSVLADTRGDGETSEGVTTEEDAEEAEEEEEEAEEEAGDR